MKTELPVRYSSLYYRLRFGRIAVPATASTAVILFEIFEHGFPLSRHGWTPFIDILVFGILGPALAFLALTWLSNRVGERDEAEARLAIVSAHERELLSQLEKSVRAERFGLAPTLESILASIGAESSMTGGAIYLLGEPSGKRLRPAVAWPSPETGDLLAQAAMDSLARSGPGGIERNGVSPIEDVTPARRVISVPIADHGETLGLLVLAGPTDGASPDANVLGVVAGAIALLIRNNQLYSRLQSQAVIDERNELAREVHDGLAQSLGFLNFKAQQVKRLLERGDVGEASTAVNELCDGSREVYDEVRVLIRNLRSSVGVAGGLVASLQQYSAMLSKRTGLEITIDAPAEPNLSPEAQLQLFRVVQEALSNAQKHAMAHHVVIHLSEGPECVTVSIEDDGLGLAAPTSGDDAIELRDVPAAISETAQPGEHFGLRIMRERVQSIGGEIEVESRPDNGTTVRITVPAGCEQLS